MKWLALLLLLETDLLRDARRAMARNDYAAARTAIERALASRTDEPAARFLSGFLFYLENELPKAIPELELAARLSPKDPRPRLYLALCLESLHRTAEAGQAYRSALALAGPDSKADPEIYLAYARFLLVEGDVDEAGKLIERAAKIAPESRDAFFERARYLLRKGDPAQAAAAAKRALACPPGAIPEEQIRYILLRAQRLAGTTPR